MNTPLYDRLVEHNSLGRSSFHTPGHKCSGFFDNKLIELDLTELPDTDALFEAQDVIKQTEENAAHLFGAGRSLISAGGCSLAIMSMLKLAHEKGRKMLIARNAHRSAVNAAALLGIEPIWLVPEGNSGYTGRISPSEVERILSCEKDVSAVYITSPTYYGELCDIRAISDICHKYGILLLVDNAHGSHLAFLSENLHPLHLGADMTACSLHKTLPVLTSGALLNISDVSLAENAKAAMSLFGSTSPSYPVMASIDLCISYMDREGRVKYQECEKIVSELKKIAESSGIVMPGGECDPLRITLNTASVGLSGADSQLSYFEGKGIDCEFCDGENAVFICTPFNSEKDFSRLRCAIEEMPINSLAETIKIPSLLPRAEMSIRDAVMSPTEIIYSDKAEGRIAADTVCPCPPGVPLVMPGEIITGELIGFLPEKIRVVK